MNQTDDDLQRFPFIFGAQYYRAPTPPAECWDEDFANMRDIGFNAIKFWVQWRWSHREPDCFFFSDLDRLMDLAARYELNVTLNIILDVSPHWLFSLYPEAKQVDNKGLVVEPYVVSHRSAGGHPGPCYNHPGALSQRKLFVQRTVEHFCRHPALQMWDVWNEPELCYPKRRPDMESMVCYCPHCRDAFRKWLAGKYQTIADLNDVWGRCYAGWDQVELPRGVGGVADFVDWREFHLDTITGEAEWRLDMVRQLDPAHGRYLHVVPNCWFSQVSCADDFALAGKCEVFASTMNGVANSFQHVLSAARGKVCYNVESHINFGSADMHQRRLGLDDLRNDLLPQVGAGIKGFMFWQYRPESLGVESPAWGLVKPDGTARPVTEAARLFWEKIGPHAGKLRSCFPEPAVAGIWRSRKSEIFHFCVQKGVDAFNAGVEGCINALYWNNIPHRLLNHEMLAGSDLAGIKLLLMPNAYYLTREEADALDAWVRSGGVLVCEAHLAGYNATTNRHSRATPGCNLASRWNIWEMDSTSSHHLPVTEDTAAEFEHLPEDVKKSLRDFDSAGGTFFPITMQDGSVVHGMHRYAELAGQEITKLGSFSGGPPCLASKQVGRGMVFYCGTNLAAAYGRHPEGLDTMIKLASQAAGIEPTAGLWPEQPGTVHIDVLSDDKGPRFACLVNRASQAQLVSPNLPGSWRGLFDGTTFEPGVSPPVSLAPNSTDLWIGNR